MAIEAGVLARKTSELGVFARSWTKNSFGVNDIFSYICTVQRFVSCGIFSNGEFANVNERDSAWQSTPFAVV